MHQIGYSSLIDAIVDLQTRGYSFDFSVVGNQLLCAQRKTYVKDEEFDILEVHHFLLDEQERKETVVYGIEASSLGLKGILLNNVREKSMGVPSILQKKMKKWWI